MVCAKHEGDKYTAGLKKMVDFTGKIITNSIEGLELEIGAKNVWFKLIGDFQRYKMFWQFTAPAMLLGYELTKLTKLSALAAPWAVQLVMPGSRFTRSLIMHTTRRITKCVETIALFRTVMSRSLPSLMRRKSDRAPSAPVMAAIACRLSDKVLTSDNPAMKILWIIEEMKSGVLPMTYERH